MGCPATTLGHTKHSLANPVVKAASASFRYRTTSEHLLALFVRPLKAGSDEVPRRRRSGKTALWYGTRLPEPLWPAGRSMGRIRQKGKEEPGVYKKEREQHSLQPFSGIGPFLSQSFGIERAKSSSGLWMCDVEGGVRRGKRTGTPALSEAL